MFGKFYRRVSTAFAITGAYVTSSGFPFEANLIWLVSNPMLVLLNWKIGEKEQMTMFIAFTIINIYGVINLWP